MLTGSGKRLKKTGERILIRQGIGKPFLLPYGQNLKRLSYF